MDVSADLLVNALVAGLLLGGFYAAVTVGISISFGILDIVNIAHPSFERLGQEGLRGLAFFFGLLFIIEVALTLLFGVDYRYVGAPYIDKSAALGSIQLPMRMVAPCVMSLAMLALFQLFLGRTFLGRAITAVAQDQQALRLMAADPIKIKRIAFAISIATCSLAGAFLIIIQPVEDEPSIGREYIDRVFAISALGGLGSLPGTLIGALLLGVVESFRATVYGPSWAPAISFGLLLLTLAVRPAGRPHGTLSPAAFFAAAIGAAVLAFVVALLIGNDYLFFAGRLMRVRPRRPLEIAAAAVVARGSGRMRSLELDEDLAVDGLADVADLMANTVADRRVSNVPVAVVANVFDLSRFRHEGEPARRYVYVDVVQIVDVVRRCLARRKFHRPDSHHVVLKQYLRPDVATGFHNLASRYST